MSEFITLQVGQCGNQIGEALWPLLLKEHGIVVQKENQKNVQHTSNDNPKMLDAFHSFFSSSSEIRESRNLKTLSDLKNAEVKARAVCIDMEDAVVSRFRTGQYRHLFDEHSLLTNYPGSGNNWAEGYHAHGDNYRERIANLVRKNAESCDALHGFLMLYSLGGGTGSGLGSVILEMLEDYFPHVDRFATCVYPAGNEDVVTAPYNVALATQKLTEHASCVFPIDNKALQDICSRLISRDTFGAFGTAGYLAGCKPFQDMNSIIVNMLLHLTSGSRFPGSLNVDMNELHTNMVPFPGLQYICSGVNPILFTGNKPNRPRFGKPIKTDEIFVSAWSRENQLLKLDPLNGTVLGLTVVSRGPVSVTDMRRSVNRLREKIDFVPWCSGDGVKVGLCSVAPPGTNISVLSLVNSSSMSNLFDDVALKFSKLYKRKAHIHHYLLVSGFEKEDFDKSLENLTNTAKSYSEMAKLPKEPFPRLQLL